MALQWLVPLSAVGAIALVVPLLLHLFSRRPPDVVPFPSLQLLRASELRPTRRARLADIALLMLRMAVLAAVVLALMQPAWLNAGTESSRQPSVIVLRDTMALRFDGPANAETRAVDADGRTTTRLLASTQLREGLQSAVAWLRTRPTPRVLDVHSSFPEWAIDSADVRALPADVTVRLTVVPPDSGSVSQQPMRATRPADSLPWLPRDSAAAWWNVLAFWHLAAKEDVAPTCAEAMVPAQRLARFAAPVPQGTRYHSAGTLESWAAQLSGEALGATQSTDVHEQRTLARWFWGLALLLLLIEQFVRKRSRA